MKIRSYFIIIFFLSIVSTISAQNINESIKQLTELAAREYLKPVNNGFGANLNTGWVTRSPEAKLFGVDIQLGIVAMGAFMPDDQKSFDVTGNVQFSNAQANQIAGSISWGQYGLTAAQQQEARAQLISQLTNKTYPAQITGPTAIGSKNETVKIIFRDATFNYQGKQITLQETRFDTNVNGALENFTLLPFAAPQLSVGTLYGTKATLRYVPDVTFDQNVGKVNYLGFGIQHNPLVWFPVPLPVDISVGYFHQNLKAGDYLESTANEYGIYASKTFGAIAVSFTPYAGVAMQSSTNTVKYDFTTQAGSTLNSTRIEFDMEGENDTKVLIGFAVKLGLVNLNVDYNIAKYSTLGAGIGFIF